MQLVWKRYINYFTIAALAAIAFFMLWDYFKPEIQLILGLMMLPFIFQIREKEVYSGRYGILAVLFSIAYAWLQIKVMLFMALGCLVFFGVESLFGRVGMLPLIFLIFLSPATEYLVNVFTFSLRLVISDYAADILTVAGYKISNHGSYFQMEDGSMFSVDAACLGLNMIRTGLCVTILLTAFSENRTKKSLSLSLIALLTIVSLLLLLLTNFLRIVGLVLFQSPPETFSHDLIGLLSLIVYMVIPMHYLIRFFVNKLGREKSIEKRDFLPSYRKRLMFVGLLSLLVVCTGSYISSIREDLRRDRKLEMLEIKGYERRLNEFQVAEFRNESSLVYIKPAVRGYQTDHSPVICWQGTGFELCSFKEEKIGKFTIMTGELKKDTITQYTAWWYDNGADKTIDQLEWRFSNSEPYRIINVTTKTRRELEEVCADFLNRKLF